MADGPTLAWQAAVIAKLRADAGVAALVGARVYDEPPQPATFPYLRIGAMVTDILPTDGRTAWQIAFSIEGHSRPVAGRVEATRLAEAVVAALEDAEVAVVGYAAAWCFFQTFTVDRAEDGKSYVAVAAFETMIDET